ncbi:LysR family transcriptional regulator [Nguyenibacter sp. L1]|nr:LysR family transcriptional regulator [Nguyenibacter sp. L1]WRH87086.1 LysR family transcriptional regulator [Nguyenibacter sp. L1]
MMHRTTTKGPTARMAARPAAAFSGQLAEVDLRLLRVFRTVAQKGGFAAAELALGKSKSSISIDIAALENRLKIKLCKRGRGGFALTPEGAQVLDATTDLLRDIERFRDRVNSASGILSGRFTLYVTDNMLVYGETGIVRALELFASAHPDVVIDLRSTASHEIEYAVLDDRATAGITLRPHVQPNLQTTPLFTETLHLYCGRRHPLFARADDPITFDMLDGHRLIEVSDAATAPGWEDTRRTLTFSAAAENIDARALLILTGQFIGFLPEIFATPLEASGQFRRLNCAGLPLVTQFHFLVKRDSHASLMAETFRQILQSTC